jgi:hypothetical protein
MLGFIFHEDSLGNVYIEMGEQIDRIHSCILADMRVHKESVPMQPQKGTVVEDFLFEDNDESVMRSQIMADLFPSLGENVVEIIVLQVLYEAISAKEGRIQVNFTIPESQVVIGHTLGVSLV